MKKIIISLTIGTFLLAGAGITRAANCTPIYNGGQGACVTNVTTTQIINPTAVPRNTRQAPIAPKIIAYNPPMTTTKGGFPITPQQNTHKTPATGPETLPFIALISAGIVGLALRHKTALPAN